MKSIVETVMNHPLLMSRPPVFVDIGASGSLPKEWTPLASYSICVAFDADDREFKATQADSKDWKRLYKLNRLVAPKASGNVDFYLTKSPFCSSALQPNSDRLITWAFAPLFKVEKHIKLPAVDLQAAIKAIGIEYVDWFKADTQGTDLRIFRSLDACLRDKVLVADFEPGIIDAYVGEDKLQDLLAYMDALPFWMSDIKVLGSQRIHQTDFASLSDIQRRRIDWWLKSSPGWCEVSYFNSLESPSLSCREYLLGWLFASLKGEHGSALGIARLGNNKFQDPLFSKLHIWSRKFLSPDLKQYAFRTAAKVFRVISGRK